MALFADGLGFDAEKFFQNQSMEAGDVELALASGQGAESFRSRAGLEPQEIAATRGDGDEGGLACALGRETTEDRGGFEEVELLDLEPGGGGVEKADAEKSFRPQTRRWLGRMTRPSESILTKVIITAASG
jgi:hypothetical protein